MFKVPWSPGFVFDLPPRGGFWKESKWPWNMIHSMPCRTPCRLYIHLAFTYCVGPSSIVWHVLRPAPPFPPMKVLEEYRSRALSLLWEVALTRRLELQSFEADKGHFTHETESPRPIHFKHSLIGGKGGAGPKFASHYTWRTNIICECKMNVKVHMDSYMVSNGPCFMVTWTIFKNHLLEV